MTEIGTCECCGAENVHLLYKCKKCGRKFCLEECAELTEIENGLCILCMPRIVPYPNKDWCE